MIGLVRMNGLRYRRSGLVARLVWVALLAIAVRVILSGARRPVVPIRSGTFRLAQVNNDVSLTVCRPADERAFEVGWLGIEITARDAAAAYLRERIEIDDPIEVRFDRRRLDPTGQLVAYLYQEGELLNATLIRRGVASEASHPSDYAPIVRELRQAAGE